jgi:hypothetical protein
MGAVDQTWSRDASCHIDDTFAADGKAGATDLLAKRLAIREN